MSEPKKKYTLRYLLLYIHKGQHLTMTPESFASLFFKNAPKRQQAFLFLFNKMKENRQLFLMKDLILNTDFSRLPFSQDPLNTAWKQLKSGEALLPTERHGPCVFSAKFSRKLLKTAILWIQLLEAYNFVNAKQEYKTLSNILSQVYKPKKEIK